MFHTIPNALFKVRKNNAQAPRGLNTEHLAMKIFKCVQYIKKFSLIAVMASASLLTACESMQLPTVSKQTAGGIFGAVGGAAAGAQFGKGNGQLATTAIGTILGAYVGSEIGKSLDTADAKYAEQSANYAFNTGQRSSWRNPDSGNYGTVTPQKTVKSKTGSTCRAYTQTIYISGKPAKANGRACKQANGSWKIVN